ncbi:MAG TPA: ABC transporter substrate-binding protein [Kofleriaceae bacterium]|nr:ABC transporter substrate-binding protein [Kofleriaceae bacterium]
MSKRNWLVLTSTLSSLFGYIILAGVLVVAGCAKKKNEGKSSSGATGAASDKATPGVTATEIKIGQCMPYSGPASSYGAIGKGDVAFFKMINEKGGINGRKINLISLDDGYNPAKAVELTRKLVEDEGVAFVYNSVGTANNSAVQSYLNQKKVPQLFVATGADKWGDPGKFPWTMGWQPSYRIESKIYAQYLMKEKPAAKVCVIYQNDDFGKDYLIGLKEGFGDQYDKFVIKSVSYEVTDPTVDSQVVTMQAAGCDTVVTAATPKFAAGVIRKIFDIGWKPLHIVSNVSVSLTAVLKPAGLDKSTGIITGLYLKDPNDPALANDPGMVEYKAFMKQYLPELDPNDGNTVYAYNVSTTLAKVLTECGNDLSRENIMKHAASLSKFAIPLGLPGLEINTSATDFRPISQLQLSRFNGTNFERIADIQGTE